jgi:hypothetical protein
MLLRKDRRRVHELSANFNPLKTNTNLIHISRFSPYRAVNTIGFVYKKNQLVNAV